MYVFTQGGGKTLPRLGFSGRSYRRDEEQNYDLKRNGSVFRRIFRENSQRRMSEFDAPLLAKRRSLSPSDKLSNARF